MAERLIEQWRLAVLRVHLDVTAPVTAVTADLLDGAERTVWSRAYPPQAFGLPAAGGLTAPGQLTVPPDLLTAVAGSLREEFAGRAALWLHLVPPHGYLAAVPWERLLLPLVDVPVLRVPDRFPVAAIPGRTWRVALVLSARPDATWPAEHLPALVDALHAAVEEVPLDLHVYTNAELRVDPRLALVHDPREAAGRPGSSLSDVWPGWVAGSLRGQSVSAIHLIGDARWDCNQPLLAVAAEPARPPGHRPSNAYLSVDDILALADSLGAATLSFGSPPDNPFDDGTRILADAIGVRRPGSTVYADLRRDPTGRALAAAYAYLADPVGAHPAPREDALFGYVQPERVQAALAEPYPGVPDNPAGTAPGADVARIYATAEELPGWVAASERYMDAKVAGILRSADSAAPKAEGKRAYDDGTLGGLADLREILDRHVRGDP